MNLKAHVHAGLCVMTLCVLLNISAVPIETFTRLQIQADPLKSSNEF